MYYDRHQVSSQKDAAGSHYCIRQSTVRSSCTSPPVSRILSTPASTNMLANLNISCWVIIFVWGCKSTPSSGIQYTHLKLHLRRMRATRRGHIDASGSVSDNISWAVTTNSPGATCLQALLGRNNVHPKLSTSRTERGTYK